MESANGFVVGAPDLGLSPAGESEIVWVCGGKVEGDLPVDCEGFLAFRQLLLKPCIQIVVVGMVEMLEWIDRIVIIQRHMAGKRARSSSEIARAAHCNRSTKAKSRAAESPPHGLSVPQGSPSKARDGGD